MLADWYGHNKIPGGGNDVLLEERLEGREVSVFALCDGRAIVPIGAACDYKRAGDGDTGPNTGGMGAYSPPAGFPDDLYDRVRERILAPLLRGLLAEDEEYMGVLYCGLMWRDDGPYVIEFNVRFGDPEAQVLMPRVGGDFALLLASVARGAMDVSLASISRRSCVGVVLATPEYPRSNTPLQGLNPDVSLGEGCHAFWGASQIVDGAVNTGGGRVLTVTALGDDLERRPVARLRRGEASRRATRHASADVPHRHREIPLTVKADAVTTPRRSSCALNKPGRPARCRPTSRFACRARRRSCASAANAGDVVAFTVRMSDGQHLRSKRCPAGRWRRQLLLRGDFITGPAGTPLGFYRVLPSGGSTPGFGRRPISRRIRSRPSQP